MSDKEVQERVQAGGRWLNAMAGEGWYRADRIDLDRLDMQGITECVCGQVFRDNAKGMSGYYWAWLIVTGYGSVDVKERLMEQLGFIVLSADVRYDLSIKELEQTWRKYILGRRAEDPVTA